MKVGDYPEDLTLLGETSRPTPTAVVDRRVEAVAKLSACLGSSKKPLRGVSGAHRKDSIQQRGRDQGGAAMRATSDEVG